MLARHDHAAARPLLARLASRWLLDDEALFQLGVCEAALGHEQAARAAWDSVPAGTRYAGQAAVGPPPGAGGASSRRRRAAADSPWPTAARTRSRPSRRSSTSSRSRAGSARRGGWCGGGGCTIPTGSGSSRSWPSSIRPTRMHPTAAVKPSRAERAAPDDVRVGLGFANLAIRGNTLDEADRRLRRCEQILPDDPAPAAPG